MDQFSSVQDGVYVLGKAHVQSTPSLEKCSQCCFWNSSSVGLTDDGPFSSFLRKMSSAFSFCASLLQAIDGVTSVVLRLQAVSQAPQHFTSSTTSATCDVASPLRSVCSGISLGLGMERISESGKKIYRSMSVSEHWGCTTLSLNPTNNVDWKYLKAIIVNLCWWNRTWFTGVHVPWIYLLSRWWRRQLRSRLFCPLSNTWRLSTVVSSLWLLILPRNIPGIFRANWMWGMTAILSHKICRLSALSLFCVFVQHTYQIF